MNRGFIEDDQAEGRGAIGWAMAAFALAAMIAACVASTGCANMRPIINEEGGGGVAVTTQRTSTPWIPLLAGGGIVYAILDKAGGNDSHDIINNGTYNSYTAGNDNIVDSQNDSTAAHAKRIKGEAAIGRRVK